MSAKTVETTGIPTAEQITWNIDVADIMWPLLGITVAVLVFIALKDKFFPSVKLKNDKGEVQVGGSASTNHQQPEGTSPPGQDGQCHDEDLVILAYRLTKRTLRVDQEIEAAQGDLIDEEYSNFRQYVSRVEFDSEVLWRHVEDCLTSVVKNNHILNVVDIYEEHVDALYLASKVSFVKRRYIELGVHWSESLEHIIELFFQKLFYKFALTAREKKRDLIEDLDTHAKSSGNRAILALIETLKEDVA